jgi:hypothetical protein
VDNSLRGLGSMSQKSASKHLSPQNHESDGVNIRMKKATAQNFIHAVAFIFKAAELRCLFSQTI